MSKKILLIRPKNIYNYNNYPPLNLIYIGSKLEAIGYDVKIVNCALEQEPLRVIGHEIKDSLLVGVTLLTSEAPDAYNVVKYIKENSNIPVVIGGWHCTLFAEQMAACNYVDYVVAGEGEEHIIEIANMILNRSQHDKKIFNKKILDIETSPLPKYDIDNKIELFINSYLTDKLSEYVRQPMRWLPYETSRGCPSRCTFCINEVTNNTQYRKKSPYKVIMEIEHIIEKYRLSHLKFIDDNFFVDIQRAQTICEWIIRNKLNITWDAECRCDYFKSRMLNDETLKLAKFSGLIQLTLGIESGSSRTLSLLKKGITTEQSEYAVKKCNEFDIIARCSFMLEVPGEDISDIKQTISFVNKLRKYPYFTCGVGTFRPYPRCELTQKLLEEKLLTEPVNFKGWANRKIVEMFTAAEYIRPWQINGRYSERAAYYLNMESAVRLGDYQLSKKTDKLINRIFRLISKIRNKFMFYGFPIDKNLFKKFLESFYKRKSLEEKNSHLN